MKKSRSLVAPFLLTIALSPVAAADKKLPPPSKGESVEKNPDGTCWQRFSEGCPPGAHCNPGPPHQVECPPAPKPEPKPEKPKPPPPG